MSGPYLYAKWYQYGNTMVVQSKLLITSLVITEYSISGIKLLGTDLFSLKFPLYNRIFTNDTGSNFWEHIENK